MTVQQRNRDTEIRRRYLVNNWPGDIFECRKCEAPRNKVWHQGRGLCCTCWKQEKASDTLWQWTTIKRHKYDKIVPNTKLLAIVTKIGVSETAKWLGTNNDVLEQLLESGETPDHWDLDRLMKHTKLVIKSRKGLCSNPLYINQRPSTTTAKHLTDMTDELVYPDSGE